MDEQTNDRPRNSTGAEAMTANQDIELIRSALETYHPDWPECIACEALSRLEARLLPDGARELLERAQKYDRREFFADSQDGLAANIMFSDVLDFLDTAVMKPTPQPPTDAANLEGLKQEIYGKINQAPKNRRNLVWQTIRQTIDLLSAKSRLLTDEEVRVVRGALTALMEGHEKDYDEDWGSRSVPSKKACSAGEEALRIIDKAGA